jgi:hypothetical protein
MAPAIIAPVIWPFNSGGNRGHSDWEKHSGKATEDGKPAKDGHKHRPSVRRALVNAHNGKSSDEQEDTRHEDKRWVAGNLFRQPGDEPMFSSMLVAIATRVGPIRPAIVFEVCIRLASGPGIPISCYSRGLRSADFAQVSRRSSIR